MAQAVNSHADRSGGDDRRDTGREAWGDEYRADWRILIPFLAVGLWASWAFNFVGGLPPATAPAANQPAAAAPPGGGAPPT